MMDPIVLIVREDIQRVVAALLNDSDSATPIHLNWPFALLSIAVDLCTEKSLKKIKESLQLGNISKVEALTKILEEWLEESVESATLDKLILALSQNGLGSMAATAKCGFEKNSRTKEGAGKTTKASTSKTKSLEMMTAREKALANSVILEEIFKRLTFKDRRTFRLVNKHWLNETFAFWRRTSSLKLLISSGCPDLDEDDGYHSASPLITVQEFLELSSKTSAEGEETIGINKNNLETNPFRRLSIFDGFVFVPKSGLKKNMKDAEAFWKLCGTAVTHLKLECVKIDDSLKVLERILLDTCPKLEELEINHPELDEELKFKFGGSSKKSKGRKGRVTYENIVAENLRTLSINSKIHEEDSSRILKFCPNVKTFYGYKESYIEGFLQPAANGEYLKPNKLFISCYEDDDLHLLRNYVKKFPSTIQHLDLLDGIYLIDARVTPFNLYSALSKLGSSLKSLRLDLMNFYGDDDVILAGDDVWFMDLSLLSFPHLTKLVLRFQSEEEGKNILRFDFGTLKAMPMLEELEIEIDHDFRLQLQEYPPRSASVEDDYVYRGQRNLYLPRGVPNTAAETYFQPFSNNLKKLTFTDYWPLHTGDIQILSTCFPNLTHLEATVAEDAFTVLLGCWDKLEALSLCSDSSLSLTQLQKIVETHEKLEIVQAGKYKYPLPTIRVKKGRSKDDIVIEELSDSFLDK